MRGILNRISVENFKHIVEKSDNWADVLTKCGFKRNSTSSQPKNVNQFSGNHRKRVQERANALDLDTSHLKNGYTVWRKHRKDLKGNKKKERLPRRKRNRLLKRLKDVDRLEICEWCRCDNMDLEDGQWLWYGKPLKMIIDHIKGLQDDDSDEPEWLRFLCPNCHTQTTNCQHNVKSYQDPLNRTCHGKKLLESGRKYICANCKCADMTLYNGYWHWRDWPIKLECNHINGRNIENPNSLDNLEWLCASCHSQHTEETRQKRQNEAKNKNLTGRSLDDVEEVVVQETHDNVSDENKTDKARGKEPADF